MVQPVKMRQSDPVVVQKLWSAILFIRAQKQIPNNERVLRYMTREHDLNEDEVGISETSSSASFPIFMWGQRFLWDVSSRFNPVMRFLPWQSSLRQVVLNVIQSPPLRSSSPSFSRHIHHHHSLAYVFLFSSQYMPVPLHNRLSCTFFDISPTFVVPLILSFLILSILVTPLIHLNIIISATSNFSHVLSSLPTPRPHTSLLVIQPSCILYFPLDPQGYSSVTQNPKTLLQLFTLLFCNFHYHFIPVRA